MESLYVGLAVLKFYGDHNSDRPASSCWIKDMHCHAHPKFLIFRFQKYVEYIIKIILYITRNSEK